MENTIAASRRAILKAGLGATALFLPAPFAWVWAQSEGALKLVRAPKLALTIGNSKYSSSPLTNPVNDARAIGTALRNAGFDVTIKLDAPRGELAAAVREYTQALARRQAVGVFYFAGHGLQLAWRNYMVPVDANLSAVADIQKQCVELADLVGGIAKANNPLNIVILDACRDNPFGNLTGADQKGLSQMDAPQSTLLAYATAPGNVASDGTGVNGLYTEHLLKEIAVPEAKVEDVFKRVRLQVRRRTNGQQIPWESTSLEEDFFFVPPRALAVQAGLDLERLRKEQEAAREKQRLVEEAERQRKLEEARKRALLETEEAERQRKMDEALREARRAEEESERRRKEEIARAETERQRAQSTVAAVDPKQRAERLYQEELAIWENIKNTGEPEPLMEYLQRFPSGRFSELAQFQLDRVLARKGEKKIELVSDAKNPYTKGTLRLDTHYKVGEVFRYRVIDMLTRLDLYTYGRRVTAITENEVIFNDGNFITDFLGNPIQNPKGVRFSGSQQFYVHEFSLGKRWSSHYQRILPDGRKFDVDYDFRVTNREPIQVPAGSFDAFRVQASGWTQANDGSGSIQLQTVYWIAPGVRLGIARETMERHSRGNIINSERHELVFYRQL
jgi:hypothetical protein